jgi:hypothetical protein
VQSASTRDRWRALVEAIWAASPDGISTVHIAAHFIAAKGLAASDRHLRKAIAYKVVQVMRRWERERKVTRLGKDRGAVLWTASQTAKPTSNTTIQCNLHLTLAVIPY